MVLFPLPFLIFLLEVVDLHAEIQPHAFEHGLDFVKGLLPKVLRLQHFGFGPLHQFADCGDIGAAQAVGRPQPKC